MPVEDHPSTSMENVNPDTVPDAGTSREPFRQLVYAMTQ